MYKLTLIFVGLLFLSNIQAQEITGTWMGILTAGTVKLRIVKIGRAHV